MLIVPVPDPTVTVPFDANKIRNFFCAISQVYIVTPSGKGKKKKKKTNTFVMRVSLYRDSAWVGAVVRDFARVSSTSARALLFSSRRKQRDAHSQTSTLVQGPSNAVIMSCELGGGIFAVDQIV